MLKLNWMTVECELVIHQVSVLEESSTICLELYLGLNTAKMHEVLDGLELLVWVYHHLE